MIISELKTAPLLKDDEEETKEDKDEGLDEEELKETGEDTEKKEDAE